MGISVVFTNQGCFNFFGTHAEVGRQQFEAFRNHPDNWYATFLSKNDPQLVNRLLKEHPEAMGHLVWQNEKLQDFVHTFLDKKMDNLSQRVHDASIRHMKNIVAGKYTHG